MNNDSRQASPDLASLRGKRFALLPEPQRAMRLDCALLKRITGGNTLSARFLHENEITFKIQCKLVVDSNYLPISADSTIFSSERVEVIPFNRHFQPEEQDLTLKQKLTQPEELSGILNWYLSGWSKFCKDGLKRTTSIQTASLEYEQSSDKMSNFLNDCLVKIDGSYISVKQGYELYEKWCEDSGYGVENKSNFISDLKAKKIYKPTGTINGKTVRNVIAGYDVLTDFEDIPDGTPTPFD
jgi:putative DNA primase/helicase